MELMRGVHVTVTESVMSACSALSQDAPTSTVRTTQTAVCGVGVDVGYLTH